MAIFECTSSNNLFAPSAAVVKMEAGHEAGEGGSGTSRHRGGDPRPGTIIVHKKEHKFSSAGYDARRAQHAPAGRPSELKALQQHREQHAHLMQREAAGGAALSASREG